MKRLTTNARLALERLAEYGGVHVRGDQDGGKSVWVDGLPKLKSAKLALAALIFVARSKKNVGGWAMERSEVRDIIRLKSVTPRGLPAHQEERIREVLTL